MNYKLSPVQKLFAWFGYAIVPAKAFKEMAYFVQRESLTNQVLRNSNIALILSFDKVMENVNELPIQTQDKLAVIYDAAVKDIDDLYAELLKAKKLYGIKDE